MMCSSVYRFLFVRQKTAYDMRISDWSSDVCSSDLARARLRQVREHLDETWFDWIGGFGPDDPFYYRIQSPVAFFELDHHCGVFLSNRHPAVFHIHTVERTPNGNDYGRAWLNASR